jgi:hypothetical protein
MYPRSAVFISKVDTNLSCFDEICNVIGFPFPLGKEVGEGVKCGQKFPGKLPL